jgi:hypothetical protein
MLGRLMDGIEVARLPDGANQVAARVDCLADQASADFDQSANFQFPQSVRDGLLA